MRGHDDVQRATRGYGNSAAGIAARVMSAETWCECARGMSVETWCESERGMSVET